MEAELEQPFFVHGVGWSSCDPGRTHDRYQLTCKQLAVGDICISLTTDDCHVSAAAATTAAAAVVPAVAHQWQLYGLRSLQNKSRFSLY